MKHDNDFERNEHNEAYGVCYHYSLSFLVLILPFIVVRIMAPIVLSVQYEISLQSTYQNRKELLQHLETYLRGVVAAEMLPGFHIEALKAQAVAARTYAVKRMNAFGGNGCSLHPGADICTDSQHGQAWSSNKSLLEKWGIAGYLRNMYKISQAVRATQGLVLTYQGKVIDAVYHSSSGGITASAVEVWGYAIPYLESVESRFGASPHVKEMKQFTLDNLEQRLSLEFIKYDTSRQDEEGRIMNVITGMKEELVSVLTRTPSGRVGLLKVGDLTMTGVEIRRLLGLRSTMFDVECFGDVVTFVTSGYGHGVGMSQYGANGMAEQGYAYHEILAHYYSGVQLSLL